MGYLRRTLNYLERVKLSKLTHMMRMDDYVTIDVESLRINIGRSLEKEFTKLIYMNP